MVFYRCPDELFEVYAAKLKECAEQRPGVNFTNIIRATFAPIFLRHKSTSLKSKYKKVLLKTFVRKRHA
jgi:hypothetical protein